MNHPLAAPPWGPGIGVYIVLTGLASGLTLVTRFVRPADERTQARIDWLSGWTTLVCLAVCTIILVADLGRPARFFLMVTELENLGSLMSLGAKIIALKIGLLVLHLALVGRRWQALDAGDLALDGRATRAVYTAVPDALAVVSFALAIYPAFLLSWTWSSPAARGAGAALLYVSSSAVLGAGATNVIVMFAGGFRDRATGERLRLILRYLLAAHIVTLAFVAIALRTNETRLVFEALRHGTWAPAGAIMVASTATALVLTVPVLATRGRIALSIAAVFAAAICRYLVFAVR
jgi:hypothetical protein